MTQEIIQMARDSGMELYGLGKNRARFVYHLEAFAKLVTEKALAEHAMREVQRLGQEIEQCQCPECQIKPHASDCAVHSEPAYPKGKCDCGAQPEQEPVAWMDADGNVSDNNDHKCFPIPLYTKEQP